MAVSTFILGLIVALGWITHNDSWIGLSTDTIATRFNSSMCFMVLSATLYLLTFEQAAVKYRRVIAAGCFVMGLLGIASLIQYFIPVNLRIDELLIHDYTLQEGALHAGRITPVAAVFFILSALAIWSIERPNLYRFTYPATLVIFTYCFINVLDHFYDIHSFQLTSRYNAIPFTSSVGFVLLSLGLLHTQYKKSILETMLGDSPADLMLRKLLLPAVLVPLFLGWMNLHGQQRGYFSPGFGIAMFTLLNILTFTTLLIKNAFMILRIYEDKRMAQKQMIDSDKRFRAIFEQAAVGIAQVDLNGGFTRLNKKYCEIVGYDECELLSLTFADITHPDDIEADRYQVMQLLKGGSSRFAMEKRYIRKDGSEVWINLTASLVRGENGAPRYFISIIEEIEARKKAELELKKLKCYLEETVDARTYELANANYKLNAIIEGTTDFIMAIDRNYRFVSFNTAYKKEFKKIFGVDIHIGLSLQEALSHLPEDLDNSNRLCERVFAGEDFILETTFGSRDLERKTYEINFSRIQDSSGKVIGLSQIVRDADVRNKAAAELAIAKKEAESANNAKSVFLANMSHEIRTPIGVILGFADMLLKRNLSDESRIKLASAVRKNGQTLLALLNDLLDLSRVESGHLALEKSRISLVEFMTDLIAQVKVLAEDKGIYLSWGIVKKAPEFIQTDTMRLRQILLNLISNSIKFTETGGITIKVSLIRNDPAGKPLLQFTVSDTGIGIENDKQSNLFKQFSQADSSVARKYGGTGLGLHLSKQLANLLGGDVTLVRSHPMEGSTFSVVIDPDLDKGESLISFEDVENSISKRGEVEQERLSFEVDLSNVKILLVEDFPDNQQLIRWFLEDCKATVDIADNGAIAQSMVQNQTYDLILMDMQMPVMDGYRATTELRKQDCDTPIVALTAHAMRGEMQKCLSIGCNDYLTKPVERTDLLKTVVKNLRKHKPIPAPKVISLVDESNDRLSRNH